MKHIVRAFAFALVVTGAVASTNHVSPSSSNDVISSRSTLLPVPTCPPDDPNGCGIGKFGKQ